MVIALVALLLQSGGIMSWEEFRSAPKSNPYIVRLSAGQGELLYFGARHTSDPDDAQMAAIEKLWKEFLPTQAFSEGGVRPSSPDRTAAIRRHGEAGLVRCLADGARVPIGSLEPKREDEVAEMVKRFGAAEMKRFYFLRAMMTFLRGRHEESIEEYAAQTFTALNHTKGLEGKPRGTKDLGDVDWQHVPEEWFNPTRSVNANNEITRQLSIYRDEFMLALLVREVRMGKRVFAVVGSSHVVMQERALRAALK